MKILNGQRMNQAGFTLIELLMAMIVSGMIVSGTVMIFQTMVRDHNTEVKYLAMQQNLRATMDYLGRYIRMAGFDPTGLADAGFTTMLSNHIAFTIDKGKEVGTAPNITIDNDPNGVIDDHWEEMVEFNLDDGRLVRINAAGAGQLLAENIEVLNFVYLDKDGESTTAADDVRSVQVTLIGSFGPGGGFVTNYTNSEEYRNQQDAIILPAQNDNVRRMMLTADISCRNMGW